MGSMGGANWGADGSKSTRARRSSTPLELTGAATGSEVRRTRSDPERASASVRVGGHRCRNFDGSLSRISGLPSRVQTNPYGFAGVLVILFCHRRPDFGRGSPMDVSRVVSHTVLSQSPILAASTRSASRRLGKLWSTTSPGRCRKAHGSVGSRPDDEFTGLAVCHAPW